jgi:hypothetical protein
VREDKRMPIIRFEKEDIHAHLYRERHYLLWKLTEIEVDLTERYSENDKFERPLFEKRIKEIDEELRTLGLPEYDPTKYIQE